MLSLVFERFTESARNVVHHANNSARDLGHAHIGTEHELLGLLADPDTGASRALSSIGVTADRVRRRVLEIVPPADHQPPDGRVPFTPRAKKVLEYSLRESLRLGHRNIAPEHLLLGITAVDDAVAMQVLTELGTDAKAIRAAVLPLLPGPAQTGPQIPRGSQPQPGLVSPDQTIRRLLAAAGGRVVSGGRTEYGLSDLLASAVEDPEAAAVLASLGVDVEAMRQAIQSQQR